MNPIRRRQAKRDAEAAAVIARLDEIAALLRVIGHVKPPPRTATVTSGTVWNVDDLPDWQKRSYNAASQY